MDSGCEKAGTRPGFGSGLLVSEFQFKNQILFKSSFTLLRVYRWGLKGKAKKSDLAKITSFLESLAPHSWSMVFLPTILSHSVSLAVFFLRNTNEKVNTYQVLIICIRCFAKHSICIILFNSSYQYMPMIQESIIFFFFFFRWRI